LSTTGVGELPNTSAGRIAGRKFASLDGVRGIAILLVLLTHCKDYIPSGIVRIAVAKEVLSWGWTGVDLFFVLSGFLITGILLDSRTAENYFSGFYARRVLRIFPLYYLVLTGVLVGASFMHPYPAQLPLPEDRKLYFVHLTNWLCLWKGQWQANFLGHFWSLAVEEQFYLVWPICVWLLRPAALRRVGLFTLVAICLFRCYWVSTHGPSVALVLATLTRMDGLIVGTLCALVFQEAESVKAALKWLSWVASITLGCFAAGVLILRESPTLVESFAQTIGISLLALGFGALVLKAAATEGAPTLFQKLLCTRTLRTLGKYSYGIYVFHVPLLGAASVFFVRHSGPPNTLAWKLWWCLCLALTTAAIPIIAALSYEYFERPLLSLKRYFEPRFSASPGKVVIGIRENYAAPNSS
jgi:peptidoglycan/LPS O-acetylase OafA/YrhL